MRQELVKRILAGDSAVWLFLETGNQKEDDKLFNTLEKIRQDCRKGDFGS